MTHQQSSANATLAPEPIIEPDLRIVDPHHHLIDSPNGDYLLPELLGDVASGHNVVGTVYIDCSFRFRKDGKAHLRCVGETEAVVSLVEAAAPQTPPGLRPCEGIVGFANLRAGGLAQEVLEAQIEAGKGRFKGVRDVTAWDERDEFKHRRMNPPRHLLLDPVFREGFACLAPLDMTYDAWLYHPQIGELANTARAFPDTRIVLNHVGGPIRKGLTPAAQQDVYTAWRASIADLAQCPNVYVKVGGLAMDICDFGLHARTAPASSEDLARMWRPYVEETIALFGPKRCMFESNFPVDRDICGYVVAWNALKRLAAQYTAADKRYLFEQTARDAYKLAAA